MSEILSAAGLPVDDIQPAASGATAEVWQIRSGTETYAFRLSRLPGRETPVGIDARLRRQLCAMGAAVIAPKLTSDDGDDTSWTLEPFANGLHPTRAALANTTCQQLGRTLAILHTVPSLEFGRVSGMRDGQFHGKATEPLSGAYQRFDDPLPGTMQQLANHRLIQHAPELLEKVKFHVTAVQARLSGKHRAICHSDLHERQIIVALDDTLIALIDFGEASILDPLWDLGSFRYFHGPDCTKALLEGYDPSGQKSDPALIESFSVAIALHHASRSRLPGKTHRLAVAARHVATL